MTVTVHDACNRYIDVNIVDGGSGISWRGTFVYSEPRVENRHNMWDHLSRLQAILQDPWFVCGDYNEALWQHEHLSRTMRSETQKSAFRDFLLLCELEDLGFSGIPYTYNNGQDGDRNVQVRLDRACADESWRDIFPAAKVSHLASPCSDHSPLLVQLEGVQEHRKKDHSPRYEIMWEHHPALPEVIANTWARNKPTRGLGSVAVSLKEVMKELKQWSKANFGNVLKEIETPRTQLAELHLAGADRSHIRSKMNQLDELLYREEMMWLQCSRITWLNEGERNTKYLH